MEDYSSMSRRGLFDRWFSYLENRKPSDRLLFYTAVLVFVTAVSVTLFAFNTSNITNSPTKGGTYVEGIIGTPRFVNPVLAITRADNDLVALVYSGLMKLDANGTLQNDLAESITTSDDGTVYNIILKEGLTFHDGEPVTTEDIAYTIGLIQSPELKSPLRGNWSGVTVEVVSEREINFVLEEAYVPFKENLAVGILPKHIWSSLTSEELPFSQHNTDPIGSGPYEVTDINRNTSGLISGYTLTAFANHDPEPHIETIGLNFYQNETELEKAFLDHKIMGTAALPLSDVRDLSQNDYQVISTTLPRVFSVFINQNKTAALRDSAVRRALSIAIDRDKLVEIALDGFGQPTDSAVPSDFLSVESTSTAPENVDRIATAADLLNNAGWSRNENGVWIKEIDGVETVLAISIATANTGVFAKTAEYLESTWRELGVEVSVSQFEQGDLIQAIIRPREYQALLFGTDVGRSLDLYPFWHSSQREDPGLNVALYTNITTDDLLEDIRTTQDDAARQTIVQQVLDEIEADQPGIFLFSPALVYVVDQSVTVVPVDHVAAPQERFSTIEDWYIEEEGLWPFFHTEENSN